MRKLTVTAAGVRTAVDCHDFTAYQLGACRHGAVTFVNGVEAAIKAAQEYAGDRIIDVAAGQIGGQALRLGLIDQVVVNLVPVVFGLGHPFFATGPLPRPVLFDNPPRSFSATRDASLVYDVAKG